MIQISWLFRNQLIRICTVCTIVVNISILLVTETLQSNWTGIREECSTYKIHHEKGLEYIPMFVNIVNIVLLLQILAEIFQDLLVNKDDYLRALRALFREVVRSLRHDINFSAFCLGLMQERTEPKFTDMEPVFKVSDNTMNYLHTGSFFMVVV